MFMFWHHVSKSGKLSILIKWKLSVGQVPNWINIEIFDCCGEILLKIGMHEKMVFLMSSKFFSPAESLPRPGIMKAQSSTGNLTKPISPLFFSSAPVRAQSSTGNLSKPTPPFFSSSFSSSFFFSSSPQMDVSPVTSRRQLCRRRVRRSSTALCISHRHLWLTLDSSILK